MKRIKFGIVIITMFGLLVGTASVASAATNYKVPQIRTFQNPKNTHHQAKSQASKLTIYKASKTSKASKTTKPATTKSQAKLSTSR